MTVLPFKASLRNAYPEDDLRRFVEKLRRLADVSPELCVALFRGLDDILAGMLDELTQEHTNGCDRQMRGAGQHLAKLECLITRVENRIGRLTGQGGAQ